MPAGRGPSPGTIGASNPALSTTKQGFSVVELVEEVEVVLVVDEVDVVEVVEVMLVVDVVELVVVVDEVVDVVTVVVVLCLETHVRATQLSECTRNLRRKGCHTHADTVNGW
jgi:hypothetical protein